MGKRQVLIVVGALVLGVGMVLHLPSLFQGEGDGTSPVAVPDRPLLKPSERRGVPDAASRLRAGTSMEQPQPLNVDFLDDGTPVLAAPARSGQDASQLPVVVLPPGMQPDEVQITADSGVARVSWPPLQEEPAASPLLMVTPPGVAPEKVEFSEETGTVWLGPTARVDDAAPAALEVAPGTPEGVTPILDEFDTEQSAGSSASAWSDESALPMPLPQDLEGAAVEVTESNGTVHVIKVVPAQFHTFEWPQ